MYELMNTMMQMMVMTMSVKACGKVMTQTVKAQKIGAKSQSSKAKLQAKLQVKQVGGQQYFHGVELTSLGEATVDHALYSMKTYLTAIKRLGPDQVGLLTMDDFETISAMIADRKIEFPYPMTKNEAGYSKLERLGLIRFYT